MSTEPLSTRLSSWIKLLAAAFFRGISRVLRAILRGIDALSHWALGDRPGSYPIFFLWIAVVQAVWSTLAHVENTLIPGTWMTDLSVLMLTVFLALVIAAACAHWIDARFADPSPARRIGLLFFLGITITVAAYWLLT